MGPYLIIPRKYPAARCGGHMGRGGVGRGCGRLTQEDATRVQQLPGVVGVGAEGVWVGDVGD